MSLLFYLINTQQKQIDEPKIVRSSSQILLKKIFSDKPLLQFGGFSCLKKSKDTIRMASLLNICYAYRYSRLKQNAAITYSDRIDDLKVQGIAIGIPKIVTVSCKRFEYTVTKTKIIKFRL